MQFHITPIGEEDARLIASWHYEAPYDFYDWDRDPEDLAELLNPHSWQESYYSVHNEQNALIGFFSYPHVNDGIVEMGLGLCPHLTGKGLGIAFARAGIAFARARFSARQIDLSVATFNRRAIHVYEEAGFVASGTFLHQTNGGEYEFLHMSLHL